MKKHNTLSNHRSCAMKHIQHWDFKQTLTREIYLQNFIYKHVWKDYQNICGQLLAR